MKARVLRINPKKPEPSKISDAARIILKGGLVVFPTETVYGIGANALDAKACRKIFIAKGRPSDNPLIVHVSGMEMAKSIAKIPAKYKKRMEASWPGPITFILRARKALPGVVTANLRTVAVRMPSNKVALALIRSAGVPIAAPSANISKKPSSTSAGHARKYFGDKVDLIIDSGASEFGLESTVLDLGSFTILRPGAFTAEQIRKAFGITPKLPSGTGKIKGEKNPQSPGTKYRHYSPETPLFLYVGRPGRLAASLKDAGKKFAFIGSTESCAYARKFAAKTIPLGRRNDLRTVARNLFAALIYLDELHLGFAVAESFGEKGYGLAIMNRLRKAARHREFRSAIGLGKLVGEASAIPDKNNAAPVAHARSSWKKARGAFS